MKLTQYSSALAYLKENLAYLEQNELFNSLMIGLSISMSKKQEDKTLYINLADESGIQFSAIKTVGRNLLVAGEETQLPNFLPVLVDYIKREKIEIPGIMGRKALAVPLAESLAKAFDWQCKQGFKHLVYKLTAIQLIPSVKGTCRKAIMVDVALVSKWFHFFAKEALNDDQEEAAKRSAAAKIKNEEVYLWLDQERVVAMACHARPTNNGISINYVYTPNEFRGNGYATKLVAELSQKMLAKGFKFCTLFTDMDNPTSNSIYTKIGYEPKGEFRHVEFVK